MYSPKKSGDGKESGSGVQFLNHFHKAFIRPYGKAGDFPTMATIDRRLNPRNCEWLCRPHTAVSELSDTLYENIKIMEKSSLLQQERLQSILLQLGTLCKNLQPFERDKADVPSKQNGNIIMRSIVQEDEIDQFMNEAFVLGGALFTASLNYVIARELMRNKDWYGEHTQMKNGNHRPFQASKKLTDVRKLLLVKAENATPDTTKARKRSSADMLKELDDDGDDDDDDSAAGTSASKKRHNKNKKQKNTKGRMIIPESSDDNDDPMIPMELPHVQQ